MQKSEEQGENAPTMKSSFMKQNSSLTKSKKWPTSPPSTPTTAQVNVVDAKAEYVDEEEDEEWDPEPITAEEGKDGQRVSVRDRINRARARLRKLDSQNPRTPPKTPQRRQS